MDMKSIATVAAGIVALCAIGVASAACRASPPTTTESRPATVEIVVEQDWRANALLTEGGYSFVEVSVAGGVPADRQIVAGYKAVSTTRVVAPGSYMVGIEVRGCPGSCPANVTWNDPRLDPPVVVCSTSVDASPEPRLRIVFTVTDGDGPLRCTASTRR